MPDVLHEPFPSSAPLQESETDLNKQPDILSEEEPSTPRIVSASQNPKYQLFLSNDIKTNGESGKGADGPGGGESLRENGPKLARWETTRVGLNHYRGSLESLASRDLDANSDRVCVRFTVDSHTIQTHGGRAVIKQCHLLVKAEPKSETNVITNPFETSF